MYKDSKWAKDIISQQNRDGIWGYFHTLSEPSKYPLTTEQALRRLYILGYTIDDEPIQKAVDFMSMCLSGKMQMPDRREKTHDWDIFTDLMLSTWVRKFVKDNVHANKIANTWAGVITSAFEDGKYIHSKYVKAYENAFGIKPQGGRLVDFVSFYQVSLVADMLTDEIECRVFDYIINHKNGIYYIYDRPVGNAPLSVLPECFTTKKASHYLAAIEILSTYQKNINKLNFVANWIKSNRNENGKWDMSSKVNDKVYFPLSDDWRDKSVREADCTYRIENLLKALSPSS